MKYAAAHHQAAVVVTLGLAVGAALLVGARRHTADASAGADRRIAFYEARLGAQSTYPAYAGLGLAYFQKAQQTGDSRHLDEARHYLLESQQRQPNYDALRGLAAVHLARHEFAEALAAARQAAHTVPTDPEAVGALFDAHLALGQDGEAETLLNRLRGHSTGFSSETRLSNLEEYRGRLSEAGMAMGRACDAADNERLAAATRAWCRVRLGAILVATCDTTGAERLYREAMALVPQYYLAREHLADLAASRGRLTDAIREYEDLLRTHPGPHYTLALADVFSASGERERASALRISALHALRDSVESGHRADLRPLALLLLDDAATVHEAVGLAEHDWDNRHDAMAADTMAWALFRSGRLEQASDLAVRAIQSGTRVPVILLHAAEIARAAGRPVDANASLQRLPPCQEALSPGEQSWATRLGRQTP